MAPKRRADFGDPNDEPDFSYMIVKERVNAFLRDSRADRGGAGLQLNTLLMRRLRSAIQHIHRGLQEHAISSAHFGHAWKLLRKALVRSNALQAGPDLTASVF